MKQHSYCSTQNDSQIEIHDVVRYQVSGTAIEGFCGIVNQCMLRVYCFSATLGNTTHHSSYLQQH
jgi:hypothetical protein